MDTPIPVICDQCRAAGEAGEAPFADLAGLLSFTPVPRRAHANGWTAEHQRAFIAALAATGSAARAARALGKHAFGAEQLRRARGGAAFSAAWDAALELARERELAGLRAGLTELAAEQQEENERRRSAILPPHLRDAAMRADAPPLARLGPSDEEYYSAESEAEYRAGMVSVAQKLLRARRLLLMAYADDPARRAAWDLLAGPTDWDKASRGEPQDNEPFIDPDHPLLPNMRQPDMLLVAEAGLIADLAGGRDRIEEIRQELAAQRSTDDKTTDGETDASA